MFIRAEDLKMTHEAEFNLFMYTDLLQLFDALIKGKRPNKRRLILDILNFQQSYTRFKITVVGDISGANKPADGLTKLKHNKL